MNPGTVGIAALKNYSDSLSVLKDALEQGADEAKVERLRMACVAHVESFLDALIAVYKDKPRG